MHATSALHHHHRLQGLQVRAAALHLPQEDPSLLLFSSQAAEEEESAALQCPKGVFFLQKGVSTTAKLLFFMSGRMFIVSQSITLKLPLSSCWAGRLLLCFTGKIGHPPAWSRKATRRGQPGAGRVGDSHRGAPHADKLKRRKTLSASTSFSTPAQASL